ncbi:MAG TPA: polysaccharide biosynthesis tyrosine autokinase [Gemmatimonadales bacterium]|nr:polysaccharide biosynthesis tyrosine autokinase [Gemmatimonadales bacterium]
MLEHPLAVRSRPAAVSAVVEPPAARRADDVTVASVWSVIRRSRGLVFLCVTLIVGLIGAYTFFWARPVYEATAALRFEEEEVNLPELVRRLSTESQVSTEVEVLQSRALAEDVIERFGLRLVVTRPRKLPRSMFFGGIMVSDSAAPGEFALIRQPDSSFVLEDRQAERTMGVVHAGDRISVGGATFTLLPAARSEAAIRFAVVDPDAAVKAFSGAMKVSRPTRDANIVTLTFHDADPELVAAVPNFMAGRFIAERQEIKKTKARSTVRFLHEQLDTLSQQLAAAESQLRAFREKEKVVSLPDEAKGQVERLTNLHEERAGLEAERAALAQLLQEAASQPADRSPGAPSPMRRLAAFPTLINNSTVATLLKSLTEVETQRAALLERRTPADPDVQALDARVREVDEQLGAITTTYLQGLTGQVSALDQSLADLGRDLKKVPAKEVEYGRLQRTPTILQDMYNLLETKLKEAEIAQGVDDPSIGVVDPAVRPELPIRPRPARYLAAAVLLGLMLGIGLALGRDFSNKAVRSRADVYQVTGMPVLGFIPRIRRARSRRFQRSHPPLQFAPSEVHAARLRVGRSRMPSPLGARLVGAADGASDAAVEEAYARLEANILFSRPDEPLRTIMFTSPLPGEGKTLTAANLAITLGRRGARVLLIDADLRAGVIHRLFDGAKGIGLAETLAGRVRLADAVRTVSLGPRGSLDVLGRGGRPSFPSSLLASRGMRELLEEAKAQYEVVVLDSPPLNVVTDAALLASHVDGLILVARAWVTDLDALGYAVEQLRSARAPALGVLLNDIDPRRDAVYDGAYRYLERAEAYYYATTAGVS